MNRLKSFVVRLRDRASLSTAGRSSDIHAVVIRLTTHRPSKSPANPEHVSTFLSFGNGPRARASSAINALISRLNSTRSPTVVLKCLNVIHHVIRHGSFILHDQLFSLLHLKHFGGYNHLNLSGFRRGSLTYSSWIRWYARFLELVISAYRIMDMNFDFIAERGKVEEKVKLSTLGNSELIRELDALVGILEEIRNAPDYVEYDENNRLAKETLRLVDEDRSCMEIGVLSRMRELCERTDHIGFGDSVQLSSLLRSPYFEYKNKSHGDHVLSEVVSELREKAAMVTVEKEEERRSRIRMDRGSESLRIVDTQSQLSISFSSFRLD